MSVTTAGTGSGRGAAHTRVMRTPRTITDQPRQPKGIPVGWQWIGRDDCPSAKTSAIVRPLAGTLISGSGLKAPARRER